MTPLEVILNGLKPSCEDDEERIKLSELDEIFEGRVMIPRCPHVAQITHTNGSIQCLSCYEMLIEVPMKEKEE